MDKKYSVKEFVYKYLETNDFDKEQFLKDRIVCTYVPFENKLAVCEKIINVTYFNNGRFSRDSSSADVFFTLNLINLYTDISINFGKNFLYDYNLLEEYDITNSILDKISDKEKDRFCMILENVKRDTETNSCSNVAIYNSLKETFGVAFDSIFESIIKSLESADLNNILPKQKE